MKRVLSLLLCLALVLPAALAAPYPDLPESHWAYAAMDRAHELGLLTGQPDGAMEPDGALTWGQYLTLLGRTFYREAYESAPAGSHWAEGAYTAAAGAGVLTEGDFLALTPADLDRPVTRREAAVPLSRLLGPAKGEAVPGFTDWDALGTGYQEAVLALWRRDLLQGMPDGSFDGDAQLTRAAGCTLVLRVRDVAAPPPPADPPEAPSEPAPALTQEEALALVRQGAMTWDEYYMQDFWLRLPGENRKKCFFLFGDENKRRFASKEEADARVAEVTVPVWRLDAETGVKTAGTASLTVHAALAAEVAAIFTEIFNDPEQFPIKNLGGYDWRGDASKGEHNCGTAIDLNWEENYQVYSGGRVGAGSYWKPGEDPFSIPEDGSVVRIFAAHGFTWGGSAWDTSKDYMHFSYLGK